MSDIKRPDDGALISIKEAAREFQCSAFIWQPILLAAHHLLSRWVCLGFSTGSIFMPF